MINCCWLLITYQLIIVVSWLLNLIMTSWLFCLKRGVLHVVTVEKLPAAQPKGTHSQRLLPTRHVRECTIHLQTTAAGRTTRDAAHATHDLQHKRREVPEAVQTVLAVVQAAVQAAMLAAQAPVMQWTMMAIPPRAVPAAVSYVYLDRSSTLPR